MPFSQPAREDHDQDDLIDHVVVYTRQGPDQKRAPRS